MASSDSKFYYILLRRHMGVINADSCVDKRVGSWKLYKGLVLRSETGECCCPCLWQDPSDWSEELSSWQGRGLPVDLTLVFMCQLLNSATTTNGTRNVNKRKTFGWASAIQMEGILPTCWGLRHHSHESSEWFSLTFSLSVLFGQWWKVRHAEYTPCSRDCLIAIRWWCSPLN